MDWPPLEGSQIQLAATKREDASDLVLCADEAAFAYSLNRPESFTVEAMERYLMTNGKVPYTMRLVDGDEVVGCSSFMDLKLDHRALEVGSTWIAPCCRGTFVNPAAKLLMLRHAFEAMGCVRVQLKCDARNERSAAAIRKLGAVYEGRLRNHGILVDGFVRDTLMFSITDAEWPQVRDRLEKRLLG